MIYLKIKKMFKKKAFLISLALLASNFLLPNQVRSGLEIGEEITSETQEVNFKIERPYGGFYEGSLMLNNIQTSRAPICSAENLDEFIYSCMEKYVPGNTDNHVREILSSSMSDLFLNLREEEVSLEVGEEITSETQEVNFKIERPYGGFYEGSLMLNNRQTMGTPFCFKETLDEFIYSCMEKYVPGNTDDHVREILSSSMSDLLLDLLLNLREEEQDIEDEVETEEDVVVLEEEEEEEVETTEAEVIDFDSITKADLPLKVYCPDREADLIIREKKKEKGYVVKITRLRGERFFDGKKFKKAVKKFKKALDNKC